jgi:Ser/Thr protein kinase RdoA (MazF antagonist)
METSPESNLGKQPLILIERELRRSAADWSAHRFDLGDLADLPVRIEGGLSNDLYRLTTLTGQFALKHMLANATAEDFESNVEASAMIEMAAFRVGVAMPEPVQVPGTDRFLIRNPELPAPGFIRMHKWVDGLPVSAEQIDLEGLAELGRMLGAVHRLPLLTSEPLIASPINYEPRGWAGLTDQIDETELDVLQLLEDLVVDARAKGGQRIVTAHRDLDAKNVLRAPDGFMLIDWEAAGPAPQVEDVVAMALNWSGVVEGAFDPLRFNALLAGYREAGESIGVDRLAYAGWADATLGWIWFNFAQKQSTDAASKAMAAREILSNMVVCKRVARLLDSVAI